MKISIMNLMPLETVSRHIGRQKRSNYDNEEGTIMKIAMIVIDLDDTLLRRGDMLTGPMR